VYRSRRESALIIEIPVLQDYCYTSLSLILFSLYSMVLGVWRN
jgi:hypothetical protein